MEIELSTHILQNVLHGAEKEVEHYDKSGVGPYTHNERGGTKIGKKGEAGVQHYLTRMGFHFQKGNSDLTVLGKSLEVKTVKPSDWEEKGRMIPPDHLSRYVSKGAIVIWCTAYAGPSHPTVSIKGWNHAYEVQDYGVFEAKGERTIADNIWLKDETKLHSLDTLSAELRGRKMQTKLLDFDFPREVGLFRKVIHDGAGLERYWSSLKNSQCAYMSVYGFRAVKPSGKRGEYNTAIVRHFVLDFDCKERLRGIIRDAHGDQVLEQVRRVHKMLMSKDSHHAIWFSGNGFHIWVRLSKIHRPAAGSEVSLIKAAGRKVINGWKSDLDLTCMDPTVPFDMARLIRIPNSYNAKQHVLRWSIPLRSHELLEWTWDDICEKAEKAREGLFEYGSNGIDLPIEQVKKSRFDKRVGESIHFDTVSMEGIKILPCLVEAACQVGSNPPHNARKSLAIYLGSRLRNFLPVERTSREMREEHIERITAYMKTLHWADFDEGLTRYHVTSIVNRGYHQHCSSLEDDGLCLGRCQLWDGTGDL